MRALIGRLNVNGGKIVLFEDIENGGELVFTMTDEADDIYRQ